MKAKNEILRWLALFTVLQTSSLCGLVDIWIFISASAFNLRCCIVFVEIYEENLVSYSYVLGKGRHSLVVFSDNRRYSSLILHQNSTSVSWKLLAMWNRKPYQWTVVLMVKPRGFSGPVNEFLTCVCFVTFCFGLETLVHWATPISQMLTDFIVHYQNAAFTNIAPSHQEESCKLWEAVQLIVTDNVFQNSHFHLKDWILSLAAATVSCFPSSFRLPSFVLRKFFAKHPSVRNPSSPSWEENCALWPVPPPLPRPHWGLLGTQLPWGRLSPLGVTPSPSLRTVERHGFEDQGLLK